MESIYLIVAVTATFSAVYLFSSIGSISTSEYVLIDLISNTKLISYLENRPTLLYVIDFIQTKLQT